MRLQLEVDGDHTVSASWTSSADPFAAYVFAHGAGAGMEHPFMADMADALVRRDVAVLRFQFPYMERGEKRPDRPALAQATVAAAVRAARALAPSVPLLAGGKSFGSRMTSQAAAAGLLPDVCGLVFLGFPLHHAKKPSVARADHLSEVDVPMLFVQGTRDALADLSLLTPIVQARPQAKLHIVEGGDHSFAVPARSGLRREDVIASLGDGIAGWAKAIVG